MVRMVLSRGKQDGIRPNDVVASIAGFANIPGRSLGKIIIQKEYTLVDVPSQYADQVFEQRSGYKIHNQPVKIGLDE